MRDKKCVIKVRIVNDPFQEPYCTETMPVMGTDVQSHSLL